MYTATMKVDMLTLVDDEIAPEELAHVGSFSHSYIQFNLGLQLHQAGDYTILTELSLSTAALQTPHLKQAFKKEIVPDICLYPQRRPDYLHDAIRMTDMPLLIAEIVSPVQAVKSVIDKIPAYFELGVQSCWIVYPFSHTITVFSAPDQYQSFVAGKVKDSVIDIDISMSDIFGA